MKVMKNMQKKSIGERRRLQLDWLGTGQDGITNMREAQKKLKLFAFFKWIPFPSPSSIPQSFLKFVSSLCRIAVTPLIQFSSDRLNNVISKEKHFMNNLKTPTPWNASVSTGSYQQEPHICPRTKS